MTYTEQIINLLVDHNTTMKKIKDAACARSGNSPASVRMLYEYMRAEHFETIGGLGVEDAEVFLLLKEQHGGGGGLPQTVPEGIEMSIAARGIITQTIVQDKTEHEWNTSETKVFNIQILNSQHYFHVTGQAPPEPPISATTYAWYGYPFFKIYEEPSIVAGTFGAVKSVAHLDEMDEDKVTPSVDRLGYGSRSHTNGEFFDPKGPVAKFRSVKELELAVKEKGQTLF